MSKDDYQNEDLDGMDYDMNYMSLHQGVATKRKRRSKNDPEGRQFKCNDCGKSYLSLPALTNHRKTKHLEEHTGERRGRGRPRKNPFESAETKYKEFFEKDHRRRKEDSTQYEILDLLEEAFKLLFIDFKEFANINHNKPEEHSMLNLLINNKNTVPQPEIKDESKFDYEKRKSCDEVFVDFLRECYRKANREYFRFIFQFVILYREALNKFKPGDDRNNFPYEKEYSQIRNCELCPDICNDFISDFLDNAGYFGLDSDKEQEEFLELVQYFCQWIYDKGQTTSRITQL